MKLETVGTVMIDWVLAVRLSPRGFSIAQVQTRAVIHTQVSSKGTAHTRFSKNQPLWCEIDSVLGWICWFY